MKNRKGEQKTKGLGNIKNERDESVEGKEIQKEEWERSRQKESWREKRRREVMDADGEERKKSQQKTKFLKILKWR